MKSTNHQPAIRLFSTGVVLSLAASALFFWLWYKRYLAIGFNELGRYYEAAPQVVYTDSAFVWCLPAFGFLLLAAVQIAFRTRRHRADTALERTAHRRRLPLR